MTAPSACRRLRCGFSKRCRDERTAPGFFRAATRAVTPAPGTVGVNLDPIRPAVFANGIAPRLGIAMPRVGTGTYATATITGSQSAEAKAKSAAIAATAGALTVTTPTPKRVSARIELTIEDIAAVGQANFESVLRENLSLTLSDELDDQAINGDGQAPNLKGIFNTLTDPSAPAAGFAIRSPIRRSPRRRALSRNEVASSFRTAWRLS